jgi:surface antigen
MRVISWLWSSTISKCDSFRNSFRSGALIALCLLLTLPSALALNLQIAQAQQTLDPNYEAGTGGTSDADLTNCDLDGRTYCRRNCTSYAAYRLAASGVAFDDYKNLGHAYQWLDNAAKRGIANGTAPKVGAVAWRGATSTSDFGHVAWVESINADGTINTSNYRGDTESFYKEYSVNSQKYKYIYFSNVNTTTSGASINAQFIGTNMLAPGKRLNAGQYILSNNAQYALVMQTDGNLVLYGPGVKPLWASNTSGQGAAFAAMQTDGNFVLYRSNNTPVWSTQTNGRGESSAVMQDDGNFVLYSKAGTATWHTRTSGHATYSYFGADRLKAGQTLSKGQYIRSSDKRFVALMQTDGNLVIYGPAYEVRWHTRTNGYPGARLVMQGDGNLVVYTSSTALWNSGTNGYGNSFVVMQNDANFVVYTDYGKATWSYKTGRIY